MSTTILIDKCDKKNTALYCTDIDKIYINTTTSVARFPCTHERIQNEVVRIIISVVNVYGMIFFVLFSLTLNSQ